MLFERQSLEHFFTHGDRRLVALAIGGTLAVSAVLIGLSLATIGPIYTVGLLIVLAGAVWIFMGIENSLWVMVAIIALLPYAAMPIKIVVTPTFLDLAMGVFFFLYIGEWMTGWRRRLTTTPVHAFIILFMVLSVFSFVAGLRYAGLTSTIIRRFAEFLLSMSLAMVMVDVIQSKESLKRLALVIILAGTLAALIGIVLWVMPDAMAESILRRFAVVGYPGSGIIRYIEENPDLPERAIATSADPNALGGMLVMIAGFVTPQVIARNPVTGKRWPAFVALGLLVLCLILTFSRGSMLAFVAVLVFVAAVYQPRLLVYGGIAALIFMVVPWTQYYIIRMIEGFQGADLATQMRFGEYEDAIRLITRYPVIGVGFAGAPDIDIYLGVSMVYLAIASNMGVVGLLAFLALIAAVSLYALQAYRRENVAPGLKSILVGAMAGLIGALANGIFDHYFFNLDFHPAVTILWIFVGLILTTARLILAEPEPKPAQNIQQASS